MSTMSQRISLALLALAALFIAPATTMAEDAPGKIVQACLERITQVTQTTVENGRDHAASTVQAVANLDQADAPAPVLIHRANAGKATITANAQRGKARLDLTTANCIAELQDAGAPPAAFEALITANRAASARITAAANRARTAVNHALDTALNN